MVGAVDVNRSQLKIQSGSALELSQRLRIHHYAGSICTDRYDSIATDCHGTSQGGGEGFSVRADFLAQSLAQPHGHHSSRGNDN